MNDSSQPSSRRHRSGRRKSRSTRSKGERSKSQAAKKREFYDTTRSRGLLRSLRRVFYATGALAILLVPIITAWDYGGVLPRAQKQFTFVIFLAAITIFPIAIWRQAIRRRSTILIPTILLVVWSWTYLQTIRVPEPMLRWVAPASASAYFDSIPETIRSEALASTQPDLAWLAQRRAPLSVAPWLTNQALVALAAFLGTLVLSIVLFRSEPFVVTLLAITACAGMVLAFLPSVDALNTSKPIFAIDSASRIKQSFGPFINPNNAAGYLNTTLACAIAWATFLIISHRDRNPPDVRYNELFGTKWDIATQYVVLRLRSIQISTIVAILVCIGIVIGILTTDSSGGLLGTICGAVVVVAFMFRKRFQWRSLTTAVVATMIGAFTGLAMILNVVGRSWSDAITDSGSAMGRLGHWRDALAAAWDHFPIGSGLGTHRFAHLPYKEQPGEGWFVNADNIYIDWLLEGGIWLLPTLIVICYLFTSSLRKLDRIENSPHAAALVIGGWFLLVSQGISQTFDFGCLIPANYLTIALVVGAVIGSADQIAHSGRRSHRKSHRSHKHRHRHRETTSQSIQPSDESSRRKRRTAFVWNSKTRRTMGVFVYVATIGALVYSMFEVSDAADADKIIRAERFVRKPSFQENSPTRSKAKVDEILSELSGAKNNPDLEMATAKLLLHQERHRIAQQLMLLGIKPETAWNGLALRNLRKLYFDRVADSEQDFDESTLRSLFPEQSLEQFAIARQHVMRALLECPLHCEARTKLVELDFISPAGVASSEAILLQLADMRRANPYYTKWSSEMAAANPGLEIQAIINRNRLDRFPDLFQETWKIVRDQCEAVRQPIAATEESDQTSQSENRMKRTDRGFSLNEQYTRFAMDSLPNNATLLMDAAETTLDYPELRAELLRRAADLLDEPSANPSEAAFEYNLARLAEVAGNWDEAADHYQKAVELDQAVHQWRYRFVLALEKTGQIQQAVEEINRCLLQEPESGQYKTKQKQLQDQQIRMR